MKVRVFKLFIDNYQTIDIFSVMYLTDSVKSCIYINTNKKMNL